MTYLDKERLILASLLLGTGTFVYLTGKVFPQFSSMFILFVGIGAYFWMQSLAAVHRRRMDLKYPRPVNKHYQPKISVVVAAHNEACVIEQTVRRLLEQDYDDYELLVMDDRSDDATPDILKKLSDEFATTKADKGRFKYHIRDKAAVPGKSAVLNDALGLTEGPVIAVFDADAVVANDFLTRIVHPLADDNVGAVQARKVISNADENWLTRCQQYEYAFDAYNQCAREAIYGAVELRGNGQLVKRKAVNEVKGWNESSLTDDLDMSTRLHLAGWDIHFMHGVKVYEEGITTFSALLRQRRRWAEGTLRRYLEHAGQILLSPKVSMRTQVDTVAYFLQFLMPLWLVMDGAQLLWVTITGDVSGVRLLSSLFIIPLVGTVTTVTVITSLRRFINLPFWQAVWAGVMTDVYLIGLWFPLVFAIIIKVLFQKKRLHVKWHKTVHSGGNHHQDNLSEVLL